LHFRGAILIRSIFEVVAMKKPNAKEFLELLKETYTDWNEDKAPRLGAALAYYTVFSMAPLLVVVMGIVGIFYSGADQALQKQIADVVGADAAGAISDILKNANKNQTGGIMATVIGTATLLLGAGGLFGQLQDALNTIWEVQPKKQGFLAMLKNRFLSFTMVLGTGFLLLVSLFISALLASLGTYMENLLPLPPFVLQTLNFLVGFAVITLLFAMIYKVLPDVKIGWHDVWIGAAMTAFLFSIGKLGLGMYLGKSSVASAYGAAGSLVVLLLWIYYAAQILFFGAEFTQVYARKFGSKIEPAENAEPMDAATRAKQGMSDSKSAPEGQSVPLHPHGLPAAPAMAAHARQKQHDKNFALTMALGFFGYLFAKRKKKHSS
jgi:membrane protein